MAAWDHPFDLDLLDPTQPFEVDRQAAHLFKHPYLGIDDVIEVWHFRSTVLPGPAASTLADGRRGD